MGVRYPVDSAGDILGRDSGAAGGEGEVLFEETGVVVQRADLRSRSSHARLAFRKERFVSISQAMLLGQVLPSVRSARIAWLWVRASEREMMG